MRLCVFAFALLLRLSFSSSAEASCVDELRERRVSFRRVSIRDVSEAVELTGPLEGVVFRPWHDRPLRVSCTLLKRLRTASQKWFALGVREVRYSTGTKRRRIAGTNTLSSHTYGLAIDVHAFRTHSGAWVSVRDDYEQGLGHDGDCMGEPLTEGGALLRYIECHSLQQSGFRYVLSPDYDARHYNHFHMEVKR